MVNFDFEFSCTRLCGTAPPPYTLHLFPTAPLALPSLSPPRQPRDIIDAHNFAVAYLIKLHASDDDGEDDLDEPPHTQYCHGPQLAYFVASEVKDVSANAALDEPFEAMMTRAEDAGFDQLAEDLHEKMTAIHSPDALIDVLQQLADAVSRSDVRGEPRSCRHPIEPKSVLGRFVREVVLMYNGLLFEGVARLFEAVRRYASSEPAEIDLEVFESGHIPLRFRHAAPKQLERRLAVAARALQRHPRARSVHEVERETNEVLAAAPDLASAHLVHHINFTHHRDFAGALHSLHNYFDLPAGRNGSAIIDGGCGLDGLQSSSSDAAPSSARRTGPKAFQHATLNLAAAHHAFGHTAEALIALDEAVRVAQQRDDHRCVAMARTWRLRIVTSRGNAAATEAAFARCLESALELNMIELAVVAALSLARHRLASATCGAAAVLHALGTARAILARKAPAGAALTVAQESALRGQLQQLLACFWESIGHSGLSRIALRAQLQFYSAHGTTPQSVLSLVKLAQLKAELQTGGVRASSTHATCLRLLHNAQSRFPDRVAARAAALCALRRARAQGSHRRALALGRALAVASPVETAREWPSTLGGVELFVELGYERVRSLSAAEAYGAAGDLALRLMRLCRAQAMLPQEVQLLISWAELALAAAPSGTAAALPTILRAVALCDRFQLVALRVRAALLLVRVFVEAGSLRKAVAELATVTPQALEHSTTPVR